MKALVCTEPGKLEYEEISQPAPQPGRAIVKIRRIGICGTDLHAFRGTQPYFTYPRILGHELSAEYISGDAPGWEAGDAVCILPYFNCGQCVACRTGKPNCCARLQVGGVHTDGGMATYLSVPYSALVHGNGLSFDELALVEPLAIGAHAIRRAAIQPGEKVLVMGAGPIGLGVMAFAQLAGGIVIAMDTQEQRLAFCKDTIGVAYTINAKETDVMDSLQQKTQGDMPAVVLDATGNLPAINQGFQYIAHGGRYVLVGLQKGDICFSHPEFHKREATVMSSRNATRQDFEYVISSIKKGAIPARSFITHRAPFNKVKEVFDSWLLPQTGVIKAMVSMED